MINASFEVKSRPVLFHEHYADQYFQIQTLTGFTPPERARVNGQLIYSIIIVCKGEYEYSVGREAISIHRHAVGFIRPGVNFHLPAPIEGAGYVVSFSADFLRLVMSSSSLLEILQFNLSELYQISIPEPDRQFLHYIADRLLYEFNDKGLKEEIVSNLFQTLILLLKRLMTNLQYVNKGKSYSHIKQFLFLLEKHFHTYKMPADYAGLMAVTPAYLNSIMQDTLGHTTSQIIQQRIMAEAKHLIRYDGLNMKEVAFSLGFDDASHFSKFFKRITGEKFTEFKRRQVQQLPSI